LQVVGHRVADSRTQPVDAEPPGELPDPRPYGFIRAQPAQVFVDACERLLEHVLGVRLTQAVSACDRKDIAREPLHQLAPGGVLAGATGSDDLRVADRGPVHRRPRHSPILLRTIAADLANEAAAVSRSSPWAVTRFAVT